VFQQAEWTEFDFWAIVAGRGLTTVVNSDRDRCKAWLSINKYNVNTLKFGDGISPAVQDLGKLLDWERQFGYRLSPASRNLDALRDGLLDGPLVVDGSGVLELEGIEQAWMEDSQWLKGFLSIVQEESLLELSLGKRFFTILLVQSNTSPLIGVELESVIIGSPFSSW
jgi:hypothetical protein